MKKYAKENCDTISKALADRAWEKRQQVSFQSKNSIFLRSFFAFTNNLFSKPIKYSHQQAKFVESVA